MIYCITSGNIETNILFSRFWKCFSSFISLRVLTWRRCESFVQFCTQFLLNLNFISIFYRKDINWDLLLSLQTKSCNLYHAAVTAELQFLVMFFFSMLEATGMSDSISMAVNDDTWSCLSLFLNRICPSLGDFQACVCGKAVMTWRDTRHLSQQKGTVIHPYLEVGWRISLLELLVNWWQGAWGYKVTAYILTW